MEESAAEKFVALFFFCETKASRLDIGHLKQKLNKLLVTSQSIDAIDAWNAVIVVISKETSVNQATKFWKAFTSNNPGGIKLFYFFLNHPFIFSTHLKVLGSSLS
jgi:hypothetical protein